jgi:type VI secretion system secreted protein VgrG
MQLDMQAVRAELAEAVQRMRGLDQAAQAAQAYANEVDKQRDFLVQRLDKLQKAVILLGAPDGVALTSGDQLQLSAKRNLTVTAGENVDLGAGRNVTLSAANAVSVFAQNLGGKVVAAKGDVHTIAHTGQVLAGQPG